MRSNLHGFSSLEAAGGFAVSKSIDESFAWLTDTFIEGLKSARLPDAAVASFRRARQPAN